MTYAIVETGGKQLWAEPGRFYDVELLDLEPDAQIELQQVLLVNHEGQVTLGHPYVSGAVVIAKVLRHRRTRKVIVYKMQRKKKTRKKKGHRQQMTRLLIESIAMDGSVLASADQIPDAVNEPPIEEISAPEPAEIPTDIPEPVATVEE